MACVDAWDNLICEVFPIVNNRVLECIASVQNGKLSMASGFGKPRVSGSSDALTCMMVDEPLTGMTISHSSKTNIVFHCYGGQNRSVAAACAFWYMWQCKCVVCPVSLSPWICWDSIAFVMSIKDVIKHAMRRRPNILLKQGHVHSNLLGSCWLMFLV